MWMPRLSGAYRLGSRTVLKAGYGMFYDTLNAANYTPLTTGYSATSARVTSNDFGQTWALGNPALGILPQTDPFPLRADGTRYDPIVGDSLGVDSLLGNAVTIGNPDREHPRVQRYRVSVQRELWGTSAIEVAYNYQVGDRLPMTLRMDYLPEEYWNGDNGPGRHAAELPADECDQPLPALALLLAPGRPTRPSTRGWRVTPSSRPPPCSCTVSSAVRTRSTRRSASRTCRSARTEDARPGDQLHASFQQGFRPERGLLGQPDPQSGVLERVRPRAHALAAERQWPPAPHHGQRPGRDSVRPRPEVRQSTGVLGAILGGWQVGGTLEYQPGPLLTWGNVFFYGNVDDIPSDDPTLERWFNVDAGFERDPAKGPANFQKRVFPFRIDGVRGPNLVQLNMNFMRTVMLGGRRSLSFRVDMINLPNRTTFANPNLTPTSTDFGRITSATAAAPRFIQFVTRFNF